MDCIDKVRAKLKKDSTVTKEQLKEMLTDVQNQLDNGRPEAEILDNIKDITGARKEKLKRLALMNKMGNYIKRNEIKSQIIKNATADKEIRVLGKKIYDPVEHAFGEQMLNYENTVDFYQTLHKSQLESRLEKQGLMEYVKNKNNTADLLDELEAQQIIRKDDRPTSPVTGNTEAFNAARIINEMQDDLQRKLEKEGSTVGYLEKRITGQMWSMGKFADLKKGDFVGLAQREGFLYNGAKVADNEWERIYDEVLQNTFIDDEEIFDVKKLFQNSRKITIPKQAYLKYADMLMEGDTFFERILLDVERQSRQIAKLQFWGTNARQQYDDILKQIIVESPQLKGKDVTHPLNQGFYKSTLPAHVFGEVNVLGSPAYSKVRSFMSVIRGGSAVSKLGMGFITSQADWATTASRQMMLKGGTGNIVSEFIDAANDLRRVLGDNKLVDDEMKSFGIMLDSVLDELRGEISKFDTSFNTASQTGALKSINKFLGKVGRLNGIESFTKIKIQASYRGAARITGSFADRQFTELNSFMQRRLREANISEAEWDFIRTKGLRDNMLHAANLKGVDVKDFKVLNPNATSTFALDKLKSDLTTKWQVFLFKEAKTMTLIPSAVDRARLTSLAGTAKAGEPVREILDTIMQFRSFGMALATRFLLPMFRSGNKATIFQYYASSIALGAGIFCVKDALMNRKRDLTKLSNWTGIIGMGFGFPFMDNALGLFNSEGNVKQAVLDVVGGAVGGDALKTADRFARLAFKKDKSFDDFLEAIGKTLGPALPFRTMPIVAPIYETFLYDSYREAIDPGYKQEKEAEAEERGFSRIIQ